MVGFSLSLGAAVALPSHIMLFPSGAGISHGRLPGESGLCFQKVFGARCSATSERYGHQSSSSKESAFKSPLPIRDFYELLGIDIEASSREIRRAYRNLQKKHHPDIVGTEGHAMTLLLNEAYRTLMDDNLREVYNIQHSYKRAMQGAASKTFTGSPYSSWVGPDRPQGIFVDENLCVGCRECVHVASNTFTMDENTGCARVMAQWGDPEPLVKMARDVCPVNCIHLVEREDLATLEYFIRPQPKASNGIYGGGWERPRNVFTAAATFKRQMEEKKFKTVSPVDGETPAQKKARMEADLQIRMGPFWRLWSWADQSFGKDTSWAKMTEPESTWSWKGLFGRSSTSDLLVLPVTEVARIVALVQEWALTFASSSELPLPMPFRTDLLPNGVELTLITASNGVMSSIGSLVVTVETAEAPETEALGKTDQQPEIQTFLRIRRAGTVGTGSLPGEGRIVKAVKNVVLGRDYDYNSYHLPRL